MPSGLSPIFSDFNCTCLPVTVRKADVFKLLMSYVLTNTLCICFIESCVEECISIGISVDTNSIRSAIWCVLFKENTAVSSWSNPRYFFQAGIEIPSKGTRLVGYCSLSTYTVRGLRSMDGLSFWARVFAREMRAELRWLSLIWSLVDSFENSVIYNG